MAPDIARKLIRLDEEWRDKYGFTLSDNVMRMRRATADKGRKGVWELSQNPGLDITGAVAMMAAAEAMGMVPAETTEAA